jgi:hypothetical protein
MEKRSIEAIIVALNAAQVRYLIAYRPIVPVPFEDFADADKREEWVRDKNALVFMDFSDEHPTSTMSKN